MPTRFPHGISFVRPGANSGAYTFEMSDATPDVSMGTYFINADSAITITNFDGGERGKVIVVYCDSASAITLQNSAGGINVNSTVVTLSAGILKYSSTGNYVMALGDCAMFVHNGTDWNQVGSNIRYA